MIDERRRDPSEREAELADEVLALDRTLEEAASSLEAVRALLALRKIAGRNLRVAVRCLLDAQDKIELEGPSPAARLDLLEAIRLIGNVEQELKQEAGEGLPEGVTHIEADPKNRRAYQRLAANFHIELEPAQQTPRREAPTVPLNGMTLNVSRGGMLAKIDQGILRHGRYMIRFLQASGAIQPEVVWGAVRRSRARDRGWEVGIEFDDPLEIIQ